jgi:hypothetical protein
MRKPRKHPAAKPLGSLLAREVKGPFLLAPAAAGTIASNRLGSAQTGDGTDDRTDADDREDK